VKSVLRCRTAALFLIVATTPIAAQDVFDGLAVGREMLAADNPGELWVERGERLFHEKRGPRSASLERCDLGLGAGKVDGAFAQLPRYFSDTGKVQDLESRLTTCMVELQGFRREDIVRDRFGTLDHDSDMEALVSFIGSKSNGMKMNVPLRHEQEYRTYRAGEYLFHRRSGPLDFSCATCHSEDGKRIRLQDLPNMTDVKQVQTVISTGWPAYRGTQATVRTMQHRLYDCNWQMRLPDLGYVSDMSIALTSYLNHRANGAAIKLPGVRR
jgi:sulfur-oxidizing protein SoxA